MSKQPESNLFIFSSSLKWAGEFYQHLLGGVATYEELAARILKHITVAHAFRQVERVRELARVLSNVPIREYQLAAAYYLVWCQCRELKYHNEVLERIIDQSHTYKTKALFSRGAFEWYKGKNDAALYFYLEALKTSPNVSEYVELSRSIAVLKGTEGFHRSAIKDLENLLPIIKYAEPRLYYDFLNSYAVELMEDHRLSEAHNISLAAVSSPFAPFYPEWRDTFSEIGGKRKQRSTVTMLRPQIEPEYPANVEAPENIMRKARVRAVIDFMSANLHRSIAMPELAKTAHVSPVYFSHLFKIETGVAPGQYLIRLRMEKAARLLATTLLSVKEIMAEVGYNNKSNFGRCFRRHFHATPSEYRERVSTVTALRPQAEGHETERSEGVSNVVQFPTGQTFPDTEFTPSEIKRLRNASVTPLQLLAAILRVVLKDRIADKEIVRICAVYYQTLRDWWQR